MNVSLALINRELVSLGVNSDHIEKASEELKMLLSELDEVEVKGRQRVDALLGCMVAIDMIIGKDGEDG